MHWTLRDVRALTTNEYTALVQWLNAQQREGDDEVAIEYMPGIDHGR